MHAQHHELGEYWLACEGTPELLFTENETNNSGCGVLRTIRRSSKMALMRR